MKLYLKIVLIILLIIFGLIVMIYLIDYLDYLIINEGHYTDVSEIMCLSDGEICSLYNRYLLPAFLACLIFFTSLYWLICHWLMPNEFGKKTKIAIIFMFISITACLLIFPHLDSGPSDFGFFIKDCISYKIIWWLSLPTIIIIIPFIIF